MLPRITLQLGDITAMGVEAIVNSASNNLVPGGGVAGALWGLGGSSIIEFD